MVHPWPLRAEVLECGVGIGLDRDVRRYLRFRCAPLSDRSELMSQARQEQPFARQVLEGHGPYYREGSVARPIKKRFSNGKGRDRGERPE
jgi:hypothetical protein